MADSTTPLPRHLPFVGLPRKPTDDPILPLRLPTDRVYGPHERLPGQPAASWTQPVPRDAADAPPPGLVWPALLGVATQGDASQYMVDNVIDLAIDTVAGNGKAMRDSEEQSRNAVLPPEIVPVWNGSSFEYRVVPGCLLLPPLHVLRVHPLNDPSQGYTAAFVITYEDALLVAPELASYLLRLRQLVFDNDGEAGSPLGEHHIGSFGWSQASRGGYTTTLGLVAENVDTGLIGPHTHPCDDDERATAVRAEVLRLLALITRDVLRMARSRLESDLADFQQQYTNPPSFGLAGLLYVLVQMNLLGLHLELRTGLSDSQGTSHVDQHDAIVPGTIAVWFFPDWKGTRSPRRPSGH
jgi:hypothetical protein